MQKLNLDSCLTLYTKINLKRIEDITVRSEITKHLEENLGKKFLDVSLGNGCYMTTKAWTTNAKTGK